MLAAIIVGTGVQAESIVADPRTDHVTTRYGKAEVVLGTVGGHDTVLLRRHGGGHTIPPHRINYLANIAALQQLQVTCVLATSAVGSLNQALAPGDFCVPDDFIDWTRQRPFTFYDGDDGQVVHTDFSEPYCSALRHILMRTMGQQGIHVSGGCCYACLEGPRYETPAEVQALARLGADVVGMTNATEAILCREAGLCFATVGLVTNWSTGISIQPLSHEEVTAVMNRNKEPMTRVLVDTVEALYAEPFVCGG